MTIEYKSILNNFVEGPSFKKQLILFSNNIGLLRFRVVRSLLGVNVDRIAQTIHNNLRKFNKGDRNKITMDFDLIKKQWHVKTVNRRVRVTSKSYDNAD
jgi:hypothetical protein